MNDIPLAAYQISQKTQDIGTPQDILHTHNYKFDCGLI